MIGHTLGLVAIGVLGSGLAASNWLRLVAWQRFTALLLQTVLTHSPVLLLIAWLSGLDLLQLAAWDLAIFAACYISYCAYLAQARLAHQASSTLAFYASRSKLETAGELVITFFDSLVYRAVYSWSDFVPTTTRPR